MYNEQIENLISLALTDGELTEKEKQILFKKAEATGIDLDEFEMVLEGKLFEKQQSNKKVAETPFSAAPKSNKFGEIKKCPSCGAHTKAFETNCADCGHEYSGIEASKSIQLLSEKLDAIEKERATLKVGGLVGLMGGLVGGMHLEQEKDEIIGRKKAEVILNFPIPNSRNELMELIHFIHPKIDKSAGGSLNLKDWKSKFKEVIGRAKYAYKNDSKMLAELKNYENSTKGNFLSFFNQLDKKTKAGFGIVGFAILFFGLMIPFFKGMSSDHDEGVKKEKERLEVIVEKVNDAISKKDYSSALILSAQLKWEYSDSYTDRDTDDLVVAWDEKREKMLEIINNNNK